MQRRTVAAVVCLAACGRVGFDAVPAPDATVASDTSAPESRAPAPDAAAPAPDAPAPLPDAAAPDPDAAAPAPDADDTGALVGYWKFDDGAGAIATDSSGQGNHGAFQGSPAPAWQPGRMGGALAFDGTSAWVR